MTQIWLSWNWPDVIIGLIVFLLSFFGTIAVVAFVLVRLPADYFALRVAPPFMLGWPWPLRWIGVLAKNALGLLVIAIGVILSLPGMPGQGVLMILLGLMLLDIPGKKNIVRRIARIPRVIATINTLRARYGKAPLTVD
jgi:hypothetical protein